RRAIVRRGMLWVSAPVTAMMNGLATMSAPHDSTSPSAASPRPQRTDSTPSSPVTPGKLGLGGEVVALAEERFDLAPVLEAPTLGHRQAVGVALAQVVSHG